MAGFMSGFGPAFAESFNQGLERSSRKKENEFRLMYEDYIRRRDTYDKTKQADAARVKAAKTLTEMAGKDPRVWTKAYEMLGSGLKEKDVLEQLQSGSVEIVERPEGPAQVDTEMTATGMTPAPAQQQGMPQGPSAPTAPNPQGGIFSQLLGKPQKAARNIDRNVQRIAETTGRSPEEVRSVMKGTPSSPGVDSSGVKFTPGAPATEPDKIDTGREASIELAEAENEFKENPTPQSQARLDKAKRRMDAVKSWEVYESRQKAMAEGVGIVPPMTAIIHTPEGSAKFTQVERAPDGSLIDFQTKETIDPGALKIPDKFHQEWIDKLAKSRTEGLDEYNSKVTEFSGFSHDVAEVSDLIREIPPVQAEFVGNVAEFIQRWTHEVIVGSDLLGGEQVVTDVLQEFEKAKQEGPSSQGFAKMQSMEERIKDIIGAGVNDVANARAILGMKAKIMAYKMAMVMGQEGRGLAETEREMFTSMMEGGVSPERYEQKMASMLRDMYSTLEQENKMFNQYNTVKKDYESMFGPSPFGDAEAPEEYIMKTGSPFAKRGLQIMEEYSKPVMATEQLQSTPSPTLTSRPRAVNPKTKEIIEWDGTKWVPIERQ